MEWFFNRAPSRTRDSGERRLGAALEHEGGAEAPQSRSRPSPLMRLLRSTPTSILPLEGEEVIEPQ